MRNSGACPKCRGESILFVPVAFPRDSAYGNGGQYASGFLRQEEYVGVGTVQAYICEACRYVEFYYDRPFPPIVDGKHVQRLQKPPGTYR